MDIADYRTPKPRFRNLTRDAWWRHAKHLVGFHQWRWLQPVGAVEPFKRCDWCGASRKR